MAFRAVVVTSATKTRRFRAMLSPESRITGRQGGIATVLIGLALVLMAMVAMRPLLPIDETRYLSVAWEMWLSNDQVHLTKNFESYTHKPPLLFWLINLVWLVTGVSELAGRLVGPATAVAMVAATGALAPLFWPA